MKRKLTRLIPSETGWVKCNVDGCVKGNPGNSVVGRDIRDWKGTFIE